MRTLGWLQLLCSNSFSNYYPTESAVISISPSCWQLYLASRRRSFSFPWSLGKGRSFTQVILKWYHFSFFKWEQRITKPPWFGATKYYYLIHKSPGTPTWLSPWHLMAIQNGMWWVPRADAQHRSPRRTRIFLSPTAGAAAHIQSSPVSHFGNGFCWENLYLAKCTMTLMHASSENSPQLSTSAHLNLACPSGTLLKYRLLLEAVPDSPAMFLPSLNGPAPARYNNRISS